jgi:hypothetical protein
MFREVEGSLERLREVEAKNQHLKPLQQPKATSTASTIFIRLCWRKIERCVFFRHCRR